MVKTDQITIQEKELPEFKKWAKEKNKKILKIIKLKNEGIKVIISN